MLELINQLILFFSQLKHPAAGEPLLKDSDSLILATSGGPDSLTLLDAILRAELHPPENIVVTHLDHGLRESSQNESEFVQHFADCHGLRFRIKRVDVRKIALDAGLSLEEAGRQCRYEFFADVARDVGAKVIATGHNADDQAETVLMHFLRGTGLAGLRGMLPVSPLPAATDITLVRPLLMVARLEILDYCRMYDLKPIIDESNADTTYFRNWLRHELLPMLEGQSPGIKHRLQNTAEIIAAEFEYLQSIIEQTWSTIARSEGTGVVRINRNQWLKLPLALRRAIVRKSIEILVSGIRDVGFRPVEKARLIAEGRQTGRQAVLPGAIMMSVAEEELVFGLQDTEVQWRTYPQLQSSETMVLSVPGEIELANGWRLSASQIEGELDLKDWENRGSRLVTVDIGKSDRLFVRPRKPGERFEPLGMKGHHAKVSDVMIDMKIPRMARERWPIVALDDRPIWICGVKLDRRAKITSRTKRFIELDINEPEPGR